VRMGSKWMRKLTEGDPERLKKAQAFQDSIDEMFSFGTRTSLDKVGKVMQKVGDREIEFESATTIAREARLLAGFTEEEIDRLEKGFGKGGAY
jgi:hypothetical protein